VILTAISPTCFCHASIGCFMSPGAAIPATSWAHKTISDAEKIMCSLPLALVFTPDPA
jgi:hypothetical protein